MKKITCLLLCSVMFLAFVGCNTPKKIPSEKGLTMQGYIISHKDNKDGYFDVLFYNKQSDEYYKVIMKDFEYGFDTSFKEITYEKNGDDIIVKNTKDLQQDEYPKLLLNSDDDIPYYVARFGDFEYKENEPIDFVDAVKFFVMYNYAIDYKCLEPIGYFDGMMNNAGYKKDEFLSKVKEFFPSFDKSQIENFEAIKKAYNEKYEYGDIMFDYDKGDDIIYTTDSYSLSGAGYFYFTKSLEEQENGVIKQVVTDTDMNNQPLEWNYEYKLNDDGSLHLLQVEKTYPKVINAEQKEDFSEYQKIVDTVVDSPLFLKSWNSPKDIDKEVLIELISSDYSCYDGYWDMDDLVYKVPSKNIFDFYNEYFNLPNDYYKTLDIYDKDSDQFIDVFGTMQGYNDARGLEIDDVKQDDKKITIHFYSFVASFSPEQRELPKSEWYKDCTLTLKKTKDGLKYQSFSIKNYTPKQYFKKEA